MWRMSPSQRANPTTVLLPTSFEVALLTPLFNVPAGFSAAGAEDLLDVLLVAAADRLRSPAARSRVTAGPDGESAAGSCDTTPSSCAFTFVLPLVVFTITIMPHQQNFVGCPPSQPGPACDAVPARVQLSESSPLKTLDYSSHSRAATGASRLLRSAVCLSRSAYSVVSSEVSLDWRDNRSHRSRNAS